MIPDPETPGYVVIEPDDITEAFVAPKTVTLQGAVYDGCDLVGLVELKLGKVNAKKKTSKVSGSVTTLDGKKHAIKAFTVTEIDGVSSAAVSLDVKDFGKMDVTVGGTRFAGSLGNTYHSGIKLTYTPKKGTFKGSFKVYALEGSGKAMELKKYTVNVSGFVLDGIGYGTATCKKPAISWPMTVK